jgi:hypothetical protein
MVVQGDTMCKDLQRSLHLSLNHMVYAVHIKPVGIGIDLNNNLAARASITFLTLTG